MTELLAAATAPAPPVSRFAGQIVSFASPLMRIRYPAGVYINLAGFPAWVRYSRAMVDLDPVAPDASADEVRVADVVAANTLLAGTGDPIWRPVESAPVATPEGWQWVHFAGSRRMGLLPAELATAFRHWGGIATVRARREAGLPVGRSRTNVEFTGDKGADEGDLAKFEQELGHPLPVPYREFLAATNGGRPAVPAVHPRFGFVVDQPFFQLTGKDWFHNVRYMRRWLSDRFSDGFLAVARVQGGMLAIKLTEPSAGSVWFWDSDDVRDHDSYDAAVVSRDLLHRCGNAFDTFLRALVPVRGPLLAAATEKVERTWIRQVPDPRTGVALPPNRQPPKRPT